MAVELKIVAEHSSVQSAVEDMATGLSNVNSVAKEVNASLKDIGKTGTDGLSEVNKGVSDTALQTERLKTKINELRAALDRNKNDAGLVSILKTELEKVKVEAAAAGVKLDDLSVKGKKAGQESEKAFVPLARQLRDARNAATALAEQFEAGLIPFEVVERAEKHAANLNEKLNDFNDRIKALNPEAKFTAFSQVAQGIAGGFTAATGAMALLGVEGDQVQKTLLKVQAALAFSQGINQVLALEDGVKNLALVLGINTSSTKINTVAKEENALATTQVTTVTKLQAISTNVATTATRLLTGAVAFLLSPLGLVLAAVAAAVILFNAFSEEEKDVTESFNAMAKSAEAFADSMEKLRQRASAAKSETSSAVAAIVADGEKRIAALKAQGATDAEISKAQAEIDKENLRVRQAAIVQEGEFRESEIRANQLEIEKKQEYLNQLNELRKEATGGDIAKIDEQRASLEKEVRQLELGNGKLIAEDRASFAERDLLQVQYDTNQLSKRTEQNEKLKEAEKNYQQAMNELRIKSAAAFAGLLEDPQDRIENQRIRDDLDLQLLKEDLEKKNVEAGRARQLSAKQQEQFHLLELANEKKYRDATEKLALESQKVLLQLEASGHEKELKQFEIEFKAVHDALKEAGATEEQIEIEKQKRLLALQIKHLGEDLTIEEQNAILIINQRERHGETEVQFEKQKQLDILKVQLDGLQKRLDAEIAFAEATGNNSPEQTGKINALKAEFNQLQNEINKGASDLQKNTPKFSLTRLLGITGENGKPLSDDEVDELDAAFSSIANSAISIYKTAIDAQLKQNELAIELNDQYIESLDQRINATKAALEKEADAQAKGYANNVDGKRKELQLIEAEKQKALAKERLLTEEKRRLQKQQAVIDSLQQASSLITAGASLLSQETSKGGLPGLIIAIAGIAALVAAFLSLKNSIKSATGNSLEKGGTIGGKRHSEGGNKFISEDGNERYEIEEGEEIINRKSAQKYRRLLKSINKEDFRELTTADLADLLSGTGVRVREEATQQALNNDAQINNLVIKYNSSIKLDNVESSLIAIRKEVTEVKNSVRERNTEKVLADGTTISQKETAGIKRTKIIRRNNG